MNDLYHKICVPNKTEDFNRSVFNMITRMNELKKLTKHKSCECKCKYDGRICNSDQYWKNNKCRCECKKHDAYEKKYLWNPAICSCENRKYLAIIMDDSAIICDEVMKL